jgi:hypothetical protein
MDHWSLLFSSSVARWFVAWAEYVVVVLLPWSELSATCDADRGVDAESWGECRHHPEGFAPVDLPSPLHDRYVSGG